MSNKIYNSREYIDKLNRYLKGIPDEDRRDAIAYYEEYFAEAGPEREAEVIRGMETPAQVAAGIKADIAMKQFEEGKPRIRKGISAVWFAVLGVFALPIALPVAIAVASVVFSLLVAIFAVYFSLLVTAGSLIVSGFFVSVVGVIVLFQDVAAGIYNIGSGIAVLGIGLILWILFWQLCKLSIKGIVLLFNKMRYRRINKKAMEKANTGSSFGGYYAGEPSTDSAAANGTAANGHAANSPVTDTFTGNESAADMSGIIEENIERKEEAK